MNTNSSTLTEKHILPAVSKEWFLRMCTHPESRILMLVFDFSDIIKHFRCRNSDEVPRQVITAIICIIMKEKQMQT